MVKVLLESGRVDPVAVAGEAYVLAGNSWL
jgi:hypothetical protein